jgi:hypothetical protein
MSGSSGAISPSSAVSIVTAATATATIARRRGRGLGWDARVARMVAKLYSTLAFGHPAGDQRIWIGCWR